MQTFAGISILCVLFVGYTHAQGDEFLGILDFDSYGIDLAEDDLFKDRDIFKDDKEVEDIGTDNAINRLCSEYDIFLDNKTLDCTQIKLVQKALKTEHDIEKRDADETQLEGSGDEDENTPKEEEPEQPQEPPANEQTDDQPPPPPKEGEADEVEEPTESPAIDEAKEQSETATEDPAKEENVATPESATDEEAKESETGEPTVEPPVEEATEGTGNQGEATTAAGVLKKGRKLAPGDIEQEPETDKTQTEEDKAKEDEKLNEHQSGNAVVEGASGATMEQHEHDMNSMSPNAKIKAGSSEGGEPKQGESAKETEGSRKDTKVLIILFVAVVVIGLAAFAYNFIKKRKQKKAQAGREENGENNIKVRSLQNLSGQAKADPENGTELKPLMKNAGPKPVVAEFKDEKNNQ